MRPTIRLLSVRLLALFLLLAVPSHATLTVTYTSGALATADNATLAPLITSVHTQSFFQDPNHNTPFTRAGYPAYLPFIRSDSGDSCGFEVEQANPAMVASGEAFARYNESIMVVEWPRAVQCLNLVTISELFDLATQYNASLAGAGLPSARTLVVLLANQYDGVAGNPVYEPYLSRSPTVTDAPPPEGLDVQLVFSEQFHILYDAEQMRRLPRNTVTYTVVRESGPWNKLFAAPDLRTAVLVIFAIDATVILVAAFQLALVIFRREFSWDIRNLIFIMGLVGSSLYAATLLMRIQSFSTRIVEMCSSYLNTLAFHILLWLWSVFVMHIRRSKSIYYLRAFIIFGVVTMTFSTAFSAAMLNLAPTPVLVTMSNVVGYWVPITQLVLACMFLGYAAKFWARRRGMQISQATNDALNRLQWLAAIAFFAYTALAFTNLRPITQLMVTPRALAAIVILRMCAASIRGIAILSVMGVRSPSRTAAAVSGTYHGSQDSGTRFLPTHAVSSYARKGSAVPLKTPLPMTMPRMNYGGDTAEKKRLESITGIASSAWPERRIIREDDVDDASSFVESYTAGSFISSNYGAEEASHNSVYGTAMAYGYGANVASIASYHEAENLDL